MKRFNIIFTLLFLFVPLLASAQKTELPQVHVADGPYLQAVGPDEFTVVWTTDQDAVSWHAFL